MSESRRSETVDYVIVGAGSAGCVLANRLSEGGEASVLVLEAGPMDRDLFIHIPAGVYRVHRDPAINWNYESEPEPALNGRVVGLPRGKVVGGSSAINSMVYMRGHPYDYDRWAADFNLPRWTYAQCLPYFKRCETSDRGASDWRGGDGPLGVSQAGLENPLFDAFLEAGEQSGQGRTDDPNGYRPEGLARYDSTKWNGSRCTAATAHLKPALGRPNLRLKTRALARRVVVEGNRAVGIEYDHRDQRRTVRANREVILAGGAINSPQLLMLSGIGPADHLRAMGIEPAADLPGVGANLQDHVSISSRYECTKPVTIHRLARPINKLVAGMRWIVTRKGPASSNVWEAGGFISGNDAVPYGNLQYHFAPVGTDFVDGQIRLSQAFTANLDQLRPRSKGTIHLASANPLDAPVVRFNYLADAFDVRELVEAVKATRDLVGQRAFEPFRGRQLNPAPEITSDKDIEAWVRSTASTDYHPSCSCRMGQDGEAVVDEEMRVHGIAGLRVVDASVMARIISGNLNAPVQMIAERASDFIRGREQLPAFHARFSFQEDAA
ncbi:MAG: choline dehydrogenase [Alphaproteobacteria bacterium]